MAGPVKGNRGVGGKPAPTEGTEGVSQPSPPAGDLSASPRNEVVGERPPSQVPDPVRDPGEQLRASVARFGGSSASGIRGRPTADTSFREIAESLVPEMVHRVQGPKTAIERELEEVAVRLKRVFIDAGHEEKMVYSLPPGIIAEILLAVYRPNEHPHLRVSRDEIVEFIVRLHGDQNSLEVAPDDRTDDGLPRWRTVGEEGERLGSSVRFWRYVGEAKDRLALDGRLEDIRGDGNITEFYHEFRNLLGYHMRGLVSLLSADPELREGLTSDAADFLAHYLVTHGGAALARFGLYQETAAKYQILQALNPSGPFVEVGCGEAGIDVIDTLDRPLVLIEKDPLMARTLQRYALLKDRHHVRIMEGDVADVTLEPDSVGLIHIHYVLHYLPLERIPDTVRNLGHALMAGGTLRITEPEYGCCEHTDARKINAIREALAGLPVDVMERNHEYKRHDSWTGSIRAKWVEFTAVRKTKKDRGHGPTLSHLNSAVFPDNEAMSRKAAEIISDTIKAKPDAVLLLPTGGTPKRMYQILVEMAEAKKIDFSSVTVFMLDEYYGGTEYRDFITEHLVTPLAEKHLPLPRAVNVLDGRTSDVEAECRRYEEAIKQAGGIDLAVLGIGVEGHVGGNERGSTLDSRTRLQKLAPSTLAANAEAREKRYTHWLTVGMGTILESRKILVLANSASKSAVLQRLREEPPNADLPASWLRLHEGFTVLATKEAVGGQESDRVSNSPQPQRDMESVGALSPKRRAGMVREPPHVFLQVDGSVAVVPASPPGKPRAHTPIPPSSQATRHPTFEDESEIPWSFLMTESSSVKATRGEPKRGVGVNHLRDRVVELALKQGLKASAGVALRLKDDSLAVLTHSWKLRDVLDRTGYSSVWDLIKISGKTLSPARILLLNLAALARSDGEVGSILAEAGITAPSNATFGVPSWVVPSVGIGARTPAGIGVGR